VRFGDRSDEELIRLAQAGWAPAFAVLVHRYAPVVRATRPRAEPAVPFLTHVFLQAMRELRSRDPRAPVAPWLLGIAGAGARSAKAPVPLSTEELDAIWTRLHGSWPNGHRHAPAVPWRRTAAIIGLAALAGLVPAVVLGADGTDADGELLELRAVPLPDERSATVAEDQDEDDEPDFSFPTTPEEQEAPPPEPVEPPPSETEPAQPDPAPEPEDPGAGADDDPDGQAGDTAPDEDAEEDEDSGGLLDGVLGDEDEDDEDDEDDSDEGAVEQDPDEEAAADDAASDEPGDS
jgi:hypothetical protein